ncbi:hypothetical protein [Nannocystis punicea]|uniref:ActD-like protein n=1 Tax=Nannocystis punicea TaxID=2995304 RepID=A0ABY7H2P2_9BACT|nr:hypothetical protein [Nannocystis poenicansa]WAS93294.1 hypothetical protein O0S08_44685 [Nannocystis poenicansa]
MSDTGTRKRPALHVEEIAAGERAGAIDEAELAALRASNAAILTAHPAAAVAAEVGRRVDQRMAEARAHRQHNHAWWFGLPTAVAAAAVAVVMLRPGDPDAPTGEPSVLGDMSNGESADGVRVKGLASHLVLHRQVGEAAEQLRAPARAGAGDVLQVSYVAAGATHGVVASLDGAGVVTLHFPADVGGSTALRQGGAVRLAQAYELDEAPNFERFVFVTADAPLDASRVVAALKMLAPFADATTRPLALPAGWAQSSFLVEKVSP